MYREDNISLSKKRLLEEVKAPIEETSVKEEVKKSKNCLFNENLSELIYSHKNNVYFGASINKESMIRLQTIIDKVIDQLVNDQLLAEKSLLKVKIPYINIYMNSYGGGIFAAFSFIDYMRSQKLRNPKVKFHTIITGGAASAATLISVTADKRSITKNGYMLIHQLSSMHWGKYNELKDDMANSELLMKRIKELYAEFTNVPEKDIDEILSHDLWFDSDKCLSLGLVDKII
jgi:ATP-dependent protease ClpP protease subunit